MSGGSLRSRIDSVLEDDATGGASSLRDRINSVTGSGDVTYEPDWQPPTPDPSLPQVTPPDADREAALQELMPSQQEQSHVMRLMQDPGYFARNLAGTGAQYLAGAYGAAGEGAGVLANAGRQAVSGAVGGASHYMATHPDDGLIDELLGAGWEGIKGGAAAGGGALLLGGAGKLAAKGATRARVASLNADEDDLHELGMPPEELAAMSDRLGVNNRVIPQSRNDKLARVRSGLEEAGQREGAAVQQADDLGLGGSKPWGPAIAQDIDVNADNVQYGGSGQRDAIRGQMMKYAGAAADHPIESLPELLAYKSNRGNEAWGGPGGSLDESAAGKAALAARDSAAGHLEGQMAQAGPEIEGAYQQAKTDYSQGKDLERLLDRKPVPRSGLGAIAPDAAAAAGGAMIAGPLGAPAGVIARHAVAPYAADAAANTLYGAQRNLGGASQGTGMATNAVQQWLGAKGVQIDTAAAAQQQPAQPDVQQETPQQATESSLAGGRGNMLGKAAERLLQENPQALGRWAQQLQQAASQGKLNEVLSQLQDDPQFRTGPLIQLRKLTGGVGQ